MAYQNAYAAYQKTNVNTASQGRLVVLLYEGAVKHLKAALNLFDMNDKLKAGDIEQFGIHLQKTQAIITELQVSLDMEKGGDIARNLMSLYVYFNEELMDATISHNKQKIEYVLSKVDELDDVKENDHTPEDAVIGEGTETDAPALEDIREKVEGEPESEDEAARLTDADTTGVPSVEELDAIEENDPEVDEDVTEEDVVEEPAEG